MSETIYKDPQVGEREYTRFRYSEESLLLAINDVKAAKISLSEASRKYGIPKGTLHNKLTGKVPLGRKMGPPTILTKEEELRVASWIINTGKLGFPVHPEDVKDSIREVLSECPRDNPFTDNRPGDKWMALFLKRHPDIAKRNTETISKARACVTKEKLLTWFSELRQFLESNNCTDIFTDGRRVMNLDETGCYTCPRTGKVLGPKKYKNFYEISQGKEKESLTVMCCYSADGSTLPPMVVYPYKRVSGKIMQSLPEGWVYGRSDSGWMVSRTFYEYVITVLTPWLRDRKIPLPVVLFLDGHKSHLSLEVSNYCAENKIMIYCLPPNATHIIQPCDVGIFRPLKSAWKDVVRKASRQAITINKINFAGHFKKAFDSVKTEVIKTSFKSCGLFPLNENAVDFSKCISVRQSEVLQEERSENDTINKGPTSSDYLSTKKVIESFITKEQFESFQSHLIQGIEQNGADRSLFILWKKCFLNSSQNVNLTYSNSGNFLNVELDNLMNMPVDIIDENEPHLSSRCQGNDDRQLNNTKLHVADKTSFISVDNIDITTEFLVDVNNLMAETSSSMTLFTSDDLLPTETCAVMNKTYEENNIINNVSSDNLTMIKNKKTDFPNISSSKSVPNQHEVYDVLSSGELVVVKNNNKTDISTLQEYGTVNISVNRNNINKSYSYNDLAVTDCNINDISALQGCELFTEAGNQNYICDETSSSELTKVGKMKTVSSTVQKCGTSEVNQNDISVNSLAIDVIKRTWDKHLKIPNVPTKNTSSKKKEIPAVPYCITLPEWREAQEKKRRKREEKEMLKTEKKKQREAKQLEKQQAKENKLKEKNKQKEIGERSKPRTKPKKSETSEQEWKCPGCEELYEDPPTEDWVQCNLCSFWWHEACSSYGGKGKFTCDTCK